MEYNYLHTSFMEIGIIVENTRRIDIHIKLTKD